MMAKEKTEVTRRAPPAKGGNYGMSRFNATRHGILSRHAVLPWGSQSEFDDLLAALLVEHEPRGPTEEHLVEEIASAVWRKRRLRLAEAAMYLRAESAQMAAAENPLPVGQVLAEVIERDKMEKFGRYETFLDRKLERSLAALLKLQELRRTADRA